MSSLTAVAASSSSIPAPILPGSPNGTEVGSKVLDSNNVDSANLWASENNDNPTAGIRLAAALPSSWLAAATAAKGATDDADNAAYTAVTTPLAELEIPLPPPTDPEGFDPWSISVRGASASASTAKAEAGEYAGESDTPVSEARASGGRRLRSRW